MARKYGVNAKQVFQWRSLHSHGRLMPPSAVEAQLLPVRLIEEQAPKKAEHAAAAPVGAILIELPGRISIRLEDNVDAATVRVVLKSLHA